MQKYFIVKESLRCIERLPCLILIYYNSDLIDMAKQMIRFAFVNNSIDFGVCAGLIFYSFSVLVSFLKISFFNLQVRLLGELKNDMFFLSLDDIHDRSLDAFPQSVTAESYLASVVEASADNISRGM